jgi:uncharacterized protein YndB with AHSA1/START domain
LLAELAPRYPVFRVTDTARRSQSVLVREITHRRGGHRHPVTERRHGAGRRAVMTRITGEITIGTSITEVFDTVADERNEPWYNPRIARAEMLTDEAVGAGSHFVVEPKGMGARGQMTSEILEYQRPHRLHSVIRSSYMHIDGTLTFTEIKDGTRLRWDWTMRLVGPIRALTPVLMLVGPRWERRNWIGLKDYLEGWSR